MVTAVGFLLFDRDVTSYLRTLLHLGRQELKQHLPVEFELARARTIAQAMLGDIETLLTGYSTEQVEIEDIEQAVNRGQKTVADIRIRLVELKEKAQERAFPAGAAPAQVHSDLAAVFRQYQAQKQLVAYQAAALEARKKALDSTKARLMGLETERGRVQAEISRLEAMVLWAKTAGSRGGQDGTDHLAEANRILNDVERRVRVLVKAREIQEQFRSVACAPCESPRSGEDVLRSVAEYLAAEDGPRLDSRP